MFRFIAFLGRYLSEPIEPKLYEFRFMHCTEAAGNASNRIMRPGELVRVEETGRFKIGDGKSLFRELPYADRLPASIVLFPA